MASWGDQVIDSKAGEEQAPPPDVEPTPPPEETPPPEGAAAPPEGAAASTDDKGKEPEGDVEGAADDLDNVDLNEEGGQDVGLESFSEFLDIGGVQIDYNDPNSPIHSVKTFEELNLPKPLLDGIYDMGFKRPSSIQETALPLLLAERPQNVIAQSQSGTGKTTCFAVGMLARCDPSLNKPQALCISPTRELAVQNHSVVSRIGVHTNLRFANMVPGYSLAKGQRETAQIINGTPGTIENMIKRKQFPVDAIRVFVLDEADQMLDLQGMGDKSQMIKRKLPQNVQALLFSATFRQDVWDFAVRMVPNPNMIKVEKKKQSLDAIKQIYIQCRGEEAKYSVLTDIFSNISVGKMLIFCGSRKQVDRLTDSMTKDGHKVSKLHGKEDPSNRDRVMDDFRNSRTNVLISTDVLARGIDVLEVNIVVNYEVPTNRSGGVDFENYLHRIGRTGRFGRKGLAVNLIHDGNSYGALKQIEEHYQREIVEVKEDEIDALKKIMKLASRKD